MKGRRTDIRPLVRLLFLAYSAAMLWLLFGQRIGEEGIGMHLSGNALYLNLMPLKTIKLYLRLLKTSQDPALLHHAFINLAGNVVLFVPLGWFFPYNWEKFRGFFKTLFLILLLVCLVEAIQYFTMLGSCDIDDLILNLAGAMVGYGLWKIKDCRRKKK